jgi:hypothetical protein
VRIVQALLQQQDGLGNTDQVGIDPAEVEQCKRVMGPLGQVQMQEPQVAFELPVPQSRIEIAAVFDNNVRIADGVSSLA